MFPSLLAVSSASLLAMTSLTNRFFDVRTEMVYDVMWRLPDGGESSTVLLPTPDEVRRQYPNPCSWGVGLQDCVFNGAPYLLAALRAGDWELVQTFYRGLRRCATVSGVPGFVARGILPSDGKSYYFNSSRDVYTLFTYAMWTLYRHPQTDERQKAEIRAMLTDIAKYAERCVVPENGYELLRADGRRGIVCKLWMEDPRVGGLLAHEALRLPMFYAAAYVVTGDRHWREMELRYADDAIPLAERPYMKNIRGSELQQLQLSQRLLWECEADPARKARYAQLLKRSADYAENVLVPRLVAKAAKEGWFRREPLADWRKFPMQPKSMKVGGYSYDVPDHPAPVIEEPLVELAHAVLIEARSAEGRVSPRTARILEEAFVGFDWNKAVCGNAVNVILALDAVRDWQNAMRDEADVRIRRSALFPGFDGKMCKVQPSVATDGKGTAFLTHQWLAVSGCDEFYGQRISRSTDGGETWSEPKKIEGLEDVWHGDVRTTFYANPFYSRKSGRFFALGGCDSYERGGCVNMNFTCSDMPGGGPVGWPIYCPMDPQTGRYLDCRKLDFPFEYYSCLQFGQIAELEDGDLLVPFYFTGAAPELRKKGRCVVVRYRFDGDRLEVVRAGTPIAAPELKRGVSEPSVVAFRGRFYLTLRSDEYGMFAESDDGLTYVPPVKWTWEDGRPIGNANTQQHWVPVGDRLYLAYTRVTPTNGHVFRNRAPIFIAEFDPAKRCLRRETETPLVPERGARLGNFVVAPGRPGESWLVTAEWMQPQGCGRYGSDNSLWLVRVGSREKQENEHE